MENELKLDLLNLLYKYNIIPENFKRDEEIRIKFDEMKKMGVRSSDCLKILSSEYFLSKKHVETLIYKKIKTYSSLKLPDIKK